MNYLLKMYLVLELEPEVMEVTIDDYFDIEVAYSWVSETSWTLVLHIDEHQWTSATMPADDVLCPWILCQKKSLDCSGVVDPVCSLKWLLGCLF